MRDYKTQAMTHGMCYSPEYASWKKMLTRSRCKTNDRYKDYMGRGITVCKRWEKFENFYEDMGNRPEGTSIDRIDNDGNYEPGNCRWATPKEQHCNRRDNRLVEWQGKTKCVVEWADKLNINRSTLRKRLDRGWSVERAFETRNNGY